MTVSTSAFLPEARELRFVRSVDRRLLHRRALSEVFLTDTESAGDNRFLAGAQLPSSHAYFTDHAGHTAIDPILLLECARQAETYGAHVHLGVGDDTKFVLKSWSMRLPGLFAAHACDPAELTMDVTTDCPLGASVPARAVTYDIRLLVSGEPVGDVHLEVGYLSSAAYSVVRSGRRGSAPVSSDDVPLTRATTAPGEVGRTNPVNALLVDPVRDGESVTAGVRVPSDNASMFDHAQDHLPGMVLTEAARQACLLAGSELLGHSPNTTAVAGFGLAFSRFAELDAPTTVNARPEGRRDDGTAVHRVSFHQSGAEIAAGTMDTTAVPASHRRSTR
ncbi:AfsA-related hotdog domain-containing protein [Streptomyces montanisoli]|uniref:Gamma-butyrolactone biosynthesis protein n=1 Tax=Streptomyces montanisoli TaxID=2798581 RepID=A0A940RVW0_9ACTN|nr:AfsA-related hotdog domain-containing protein [Streptomyces montanisoli]MBP0458785.1 gamma-butyrolactone biosynthesis protein [Streptomyces montanisoli]